MGLKMSTGALDDAVTLDDQMAADIDYRRPPRGGADMFGMIGDFAGKTILDVGCGLGPYRRDVERIGATWVGLELGGDACTVVGDGDRLPFVDATFDGVLCSAVLEHMPHPDKTVAEIARVIKPGGKFFGYVSFLEPFHGISYHHLSHKGVEQLLRDSGFKPLNIFPSENGTAFQIESMLFPKYVPVLQPMFRWLSQSACNVTLYMNYLSRRALHVVQGRRDADPNRYLDFVRLRFAVGFNFVAERNDGAGAPSTGYATLKQDR